MKTNPVTDVLETIRKEVKSSKDWNGHLCFPLKLHLPAGGVLYTCKFRTKKPAFRILGLVGDDLQVQSAQLEISHGNGQWKPVEISAADRALLLKFAIREMDGNGWQFHGA
jgi:hypothetical protein